EGLRFDREALAAAATDEFLAATDLADLLVRRGIPFRESHGVVAGLVRRALDEGRSLSSFTLGERAEHSPALDGEYYEVLARAARTRTLFGPPGRASVYRSYGIRALLDAVAGEGGRGAAVLIRALEPWAGVEAMRDRRRLERAHELCSGPGKLTQALAIELHHDGPDLATGPVRMHPRPLDRP